MYIFFIFFYDNIMNLSVQNSTSEHEFYTQTSADIIKGLNTDPEEGLTVDEAKKRLANEGENRLPEPQKVSVLHLLFRQFTNFIIYILLGATVLSFILGDVKDAILIGVVVLINAAIGFYQEYKAERTLASLKKMAAPTAKIVRNGQIEEIQTFEIVRGDIVVLEEGDIVPADLRLTESVGLEINESVLTGESVPVQKDSRDVIENKVSVGERLNMTFMGTVTTSGHGRGVVVAVGAQTQIGKIAKTLATPYEKPTPLQRNLTALGKLIVLAAIVVAAVIFVIGALQGRDLNEQLFTVISLAVAVIPEGLIAVVTVTMAIGVQRMAKRNAIVRSLPAVETLGAVNVICSDKTGTLTEGKMVATDLWVGDKLYTVSGVGIRPEGSIYCDDKPVRDMPQDLKTALLIASLCNDSVLQQDEEGTWEGVGDTTEIALQVLAHKLDVKKEDIEKRSKFIEGLPFDSDRKRMSMVFELNGKPTVLTKGAPEEVLNACTHFLKDGQIIPLDGEKNHYKKINQDMANRGLRVLALARRELTQIPVDFEPSTVESGMTLVGMVGVLDPARPEAKEAVAKCRTAGIRVIMITGDHPATASNIAAQLGIFDPQTDKVMAGNELDHLSEHDLMKLEKFPRVFARVSPENKLMLITTLRKMNYIVAMTGDGVNDATAIKHSNVGVAMGKEGTDVTRQAADIVLADDNFATIVSAVEEGRRIFANIRKFIRYLLSCNFSNVFGILFATIAGIPLPFTPVQILWLNLVTDTPPALALGFDKLDPKAMEKLPRDPKKGIFRKADVVFILLHGALMAGLMLAVFLTEVSAGNASIEKARTMAFAMLVLVQLTQAFNARSTKLTLLSKDVFANKSLVMGVTVSLGLMLIGMYTPILKGIFEQVSLGIQDWAKLMVGVGFFVVATEFVKWIRRKYFSESMMHA